MYERAGLESESRSRGRRRAARVQESGRCRTWRPAQVDRRTAADRPLPRLPDGRHLRNDLDFQGRQRPGTRGREHLHRQRARRHRPRTPAPERNRHPDRPRVCHRRRGADGTRVVPDASADGPDAVSRRRHRRPPARDRSRRRADRGRRRVRRDADEPLRPLTLDGNREFDDPAGASARVARRATRPGRSVGDRTGSREWTGRRLDLSPSGTGDGRTTRVRPADDREHGDLRGRIADDRGRDGHPCETERARCSFGGDSGRPADGARWLERMH